MSGNGKLSALERKLKELDQQSSLLQDDIRKLSRSIHKAERSGQPPEIPPLSHSEPMLPPPEVTEAPAPAAKRTTGRLLTVQAEPRPPEALEPEPLPRDASGTAAGLRPDFARNERFVSYLASGSFGRARPLGREKRLQRNKAIFMLITALLFAFIVVRVFFY